MTVEELKAALLNRAYQTPIRIDVHEEIENNVDRFLKIQFIECDQWSRDIEKCPAYRRLIKFYESTKTE